MVAEGWVLFQNSHVFIHHLLGISLRAQAVLLVCFRLKEKEEASFREITPILELECRFHVKLEVHWQAFEFHRFFILVELDAHVLSLVTLVLQNEHSFTLRYHGLVVGDFASWRPLNFL